MKSVEIHNQHYELYTWQEFGQHVLALAKNIIEAGEEFDRLIALAKGGTAIARPVGDLCGIRELSSIQIEFYTGIAETARTPVITQSLPVKIKGERVLVIDDIADSGETLIMADNYLKHHGVSEIKTATLVTKSWTKYQPDYSYHKTDAWVIFPWEIRETIQLLTAIWEKKGDSSDNIKAQLQEMGFSPEVISICFKQGGK